MGLFYMTKHILKETSDMQILFKGREGAGLRGWGGGTFVNCLVGFASPALHVFTPFLMMTRYTNQYLQV